LFLGLDPRNKLADNVLSAVAITALIAFWV